MLFYRNSLWIAGLLVLLAVSNPRVSLFAAEAASKPAAKGGMVLADDQLAEAIRARYAKSKIGVNHFTVTVKGGVATIEGLAQVPQHKGVATRLAKLAGAKTVRNQIRVSGAKAPAARKAKPAKAEAPEKKAGQPGDTGGKYEPESTENKRPRRVTVRWVKARPQ